MKTFPAHQIGIDEGELVLFSDFENDGPMWSGEGPRVHEQKINFSRPFLDPPSVQVGLAMWDISNVATSRVDLRKENVTQEGFTLSLRTWDNTKIARVRVSWQAIGPVANEDDWQIE